MEVFRQDYQPLPYTVSKVSLDFDIYDGKTIVTSEFSIIENTNVTIPESLKDALVLDGDESVVTLHSISVDGSTLVQDEHYSLETGKLILKNPKSGQVISVVVEIVPETNTTLQGLYKSSGSYCTQCEAMGFRRITYYPDRPDNMAIFDKVRICAYKDQYPVLLSNGNLLETGIALDDGTDTATTRCRHYAIWSDPFPKPSYLFAIVAGNLGNHEDFFTTRSGRTVRLIIHSEHQNVCKLKYAMGALKRAMKWDEDRFGLEYDLDIFNIVAVEDFNMGAMENKSLNIFNTALVVADVKTQTDANFERVEGIIGHEYFHNWTGNRVTCRDWFQLTLKEGLTVFRDQEFSGDMNSKPVNRIENVRILRASQFGEDAGPMSHPIRPDSYISMENFYTATVYEKGAEVIRMYQTILGVDGFNKGMRLYFERHDGQGVTCDEFLAAMADANNVDLSVFSRWYSTPGTPTLQYSLKYEDGVATITLSQTSKCEHPLHIPVVIGLLDKATGKEVVASTVLNLKEMVQTFSFDGLDGEVVPSVLRDFSAPVKLKDENDEQDEELLAFLAANDTDSFNRWEAGQKLLTTLIFQVMNDKLSEKTLKYADDAFRLALLDSTMDDSIKSYSIQLPVESSLAEELTVVDPLALRKARGHVKQLIARQNRITLSAMYDGLTVAMSGNAVVEVDASAIGKRRLRNTLLGLLCSICKSDEEMEVAAKLAMKHYTSAACMTDKMAAFVILASMDGKGTPYREEAVESFYKEADGDPLVVNKWFAAQASADLPDILERIRQLKEHADFSLVNPNRCRSLLVSFATNPVAFHDVTGAGYVLMTELLAELDAINPKIASSITALCMINWKRYDENRGSQMKAQLENLSKMKLSPDLNEIVSRGLK